MTDRDLWAEARRLVVSEGLTYAEVAEETGLPKSTIEKRAAREDWQGERERAVAYALQARAFKALALKAATAALSNAATLEDQVKAAQLGHLWMGAEKAYPEHRYTRPADQEPEVDPLEQETDEQLLERARRAVEDRS